MGRTVVVVRTLDVKRPEHRVDVVVGNVVVSPCHILPSSYLALGLATCYGNGLIVIPRGQDHWYPTNLVHGVFKPIVISRVEWVRSQPNFERLGLLL